MRHLLIATILTLLTFCSKAQFERLVVNEVSKDYIELVVVGKKTCTDSTADLRGFIIDDHNGWFGTTLSGTTNISTGHLRFGYWNGNYNKIPYGSIIVIYNEEYRATIKNLPADDPNDDLKPDGVYILPSSSGYFDNDNANPSSSLTSPYYSYPSQSPISGANGNGWDRIELNPLGDAITIVERNGLLNNATFSLVYGTLKNLPVQTPTVYKSDDLSSNKILYLTNGLYANAVNWASSNQSNETPGLGNGGDNSLWIQKMRTPVLRPKINIITPAAVCSPTILSLANAVNSNSFLPQGNQLSYYSDAAATQPVSNSTAINSSGTYYIKAAAPGETECIDIQPVTITIKPLPLAPGINVTNSCTGSSTLSASGITGQILWSNGATTPSITVTSPGSYSITQTLNGCTSAASSAMAAPGTPTPPPTITVVDNCDGTSKLTASGTGNFLWSNGSTNASIVVNTAGAYSVTQNINGCVSSPASATASPKAPVAPPSISVSNNCDGTTTLTASGIGTFTWSNGSTNTAITVSSAGSYSVSQTVNGCTSASASATANPLTVLSVTVSSASICKGNNATIKATPSAAGNYSYSWAVPNGATNPGNVATFQASVTGTYTATLTSSTGCVVTGSGSLDLLPSTVITAADKAVCTGSSVQLSALPAGGLWSGANVSGSVFNAVNLTAGTYPVTYTIQSAGGCTSTATANITVNALPTIPVIAIAQPGCSATTGTLTLSSSTTGLDISLDGGAFAAYPSNGYSVSPGNHSITIRNASGCISTATATVNNPPTAPVNPVLSVIQPNCTTATGLINITSSTIGLEYNIDGGAFASYPANGFVVNAGTHTISVRNTAGCTTTVISTINSAPVAPALPIVSIVHPTCSNPSGVLTLTSSTTGLEVSLDGGSFTTYSAPGYTVNPGTHTITVRNSSGCITSVNAVVNIALNGPSTPIISTTQPNCSTTTGNIIITSSTIGLEYNIDGGAFASYPANGFVVNAGTHTISVRNTAGCTTTVISIINTAPVAPALPTVSIVHPTCSNPSGLLSLTSSTTGLEVSLDGGTFNAYSAQGYTVNPGTHTITVRNTSGCTTSVNAVVNSALNGPYTPIIFTTQPNCSTTTGRINITSSTSGLEVSLDGGAFVSYAPNGYIVNPGTHTITVRNTAGCTTSINAIIDASLAAPVTPIINILQPTCSTPTGTIKITSPTTGLVFSLDGGAFASYPSIGYSVGVGTHTITVRNADGCTATVNAVINAGLNAPSAPTLNVLQPSCSAPLGTVTVSSPVGNGITYSMNGNNYQVSNIFNNLAGGNYNVFAKSSSGCVSPASVVVIIPAASTIKATASATISCGQSTGSIVVNASGGAGNYTYSLNGGSFVASNNFTNLQPGDYVVTVKDGQGCTLQVSISLKAIPSFTLTLSANQYSVPQGSTVNLSVTGTGISKIISWLPKNIFTNQFTNTQTFKADSSVNITVIAESAAGCVDTAAVAVVVTPVTDIYIPSAFTPNGDGKNDVFRILGSDIKELDFKVYNRWGQMIFSSKTPAKGWDGTLSGKSQPGDVYIYYVAIMKLDGTTITKKGTVTLVR